MIQPGKLSDVELVEALELAAPRARLAAAEDLRQIADMIAGLALEAAARLAEFAGDRKLLELRRRVSRLEDAAFHFQTCATCRRQGDGACNSGSWFAAFLRGEHDEEGQATPAAAGSGPMLGKVSDVVLHADGRLTCSLEVNGAGRAFLEQLRRGDPVEGLGFNGGKS